MYAAHRNNRPWNFEKKESGKPVPAYDPACYLCPGNKRVNGMQNPAYENVFVFENDHPVVGLNAPSIPKEFQSQHDGLYKKGEAGGIAKVVCYDPGHHVTLNDTGTDKVAEVLKTLRAEMVFFQQHEKIKSVLIFENKGEIVGVSNPHPHCQIYATDFVFNVIGKEMAAADEYRKLNQRNIFSDIIRAEQKDELRIIAENKNAIAFIPFFARFAYETYVFPKKQHTTLISMNDEELYDLAEVFQTTTKKMDANFKSSFPYILAFAQAPVDGNKYEGYHMHLSMKGHQKQTWSLQETPAIRVNFHIKVSLPIFLPVVSK